MVVGTVLLSLLGYRSHRTHSLNRILTTGCLAREHQRIGTGVDGVGNIGHLSTCGTRIVNHRVQHLRSHNHRLLLLLTLADKLALNTRNALYGHLDTQVATRNHDTIGSVDNLVDIVDTLLVLNFRYNLDVGIIGVQNGLNGTHISCRAHKGVGNEVDILLNGQHDVLTVLAGQCGQVDMSTRHIHTLMRPQHTIVGDLSNNGRTVDANHHHIQGAIVEEHMVALLYIGCKVLVRQIYDVMGRVNLRAPKQLHHIARLILDMPFTTRRTNLRTLGVDEDTDMATHLAHVPYYILYPFLRSMGSVHSYDIYTRIE